MGCLGAMVTQTVAVSMLWPFFSSFFFCVEGKGLEATESLFITQLFHKMSYRKLKCFSLRQSSHNGCCISSSRPQLLQKTVIIGVGERTLSRGGVMCSGGGGGDHVGKIALTARDAGCAC